MRYLKCFNILTLFVSVIFLGGFPAVVPAEVVVQPVRSLEVIRTDNLGNDLSYPSALFYDAEANEIYVTSPLKNKLIVLTSDYFPYLSLGAGRGLNSVTGCFVRKGRLYVCGGASKDDPRGHIVMLNGAFLPDGKIYFSGFADADSFLPRKVVVGDSGNIYVSGLTGVGVVVLDPSGNYLRTLEPRDEVLGVSELVSIISMAVGKDGRLYLLSEGMGRVYVYDRNEKFLYKFGQKGGEPGKLARPRGIAVDDRNQRVYVVDYQRHTVSVFATNGEFQFEFGGMGDGRGWLNYPSDVCIDGFGRILVADTFNHRIQVFELAGGKPSASPPTVPAESVSDGQLQVKEITETEQPPAPSAEEPPAPAKAQAPDIPRDAYVLQVAFAREPANAQALLERLSAKGYSVFIYEVDKGAAKGVWYKVLIGPFADREGAETAAERLKTEEKLTAIITKR